MMDPRQQFKWAIALLAASSRDRRFLRDRHLVEDALLRPAFPGNVEYARACFMIVAMGFGPDPRLARAGEKLAKVFPNDSRLLGDLAYCYMPIFESDCKRMLQIAGKIAQLVPNRPLGYEVYAFIYDWRWSSLKKDPKRAENARLAIRYCKEALSKGTSDESERQWLVDLVGKAQKWLYKNGLKE